MGADDVLIFTGEYWSGGDLEANGALKLLFFRSNLAVDVVEQFQVFWLGNNFDLEACRLPGLPGRQVGPTPEPLQAPVRRPPAA